MSVDGVNNPLPKIVGKSDNPVDDVAKTDDGSADKQSIIDSTTKMLKEQAWLQRFSTETNLKSTEIKVLADTLKGIVRNMA